MRYEAPSSTIDVFLNGAPTGLTGTLAVRLMKVVTGGADSTAVARTTTGIVENPTGSGIYQATITLPATTGDYYPVWDDATTFTRDDETIRVTHNLPAPVGGTGNPYFTPTEFKAKYPNDDAVQSLSDDAINAARTIAEDIIERACHVAFVVREKTILVSGQRTTRIELPIYSLRSVESVSVDGEAQDVSDYRVGSGGIYRSTTWPRSVSNVEVTVTHGYDAPTAWIKDAAMTLTFHRAIKGPLTDRAISASAGEGNGTIALLTPGVQGSVTGIPDVDEAIAMHRLADPLSVSSVQMADASNTYPDPLEDFATG